jgi:trk system potassium uptake protein
MKPKLLGIFSPARILVLSIIGSIPISMLLLSLPWCCAAPLSWGDLFFMTTSFVTVTGLSTVSLSSFTLLGQIIILCLLQIGGLGIITLTLFLVSLFVDFGIATRVFGAQILALDSWKDIRHIIIFIISLSLIIEIIGAIGIFLVIYHEYNPGYALFLSVFHAVSAFASAGFSIFPFEFLPYKNNYALLLIVWCIMIAREIGFMVWHEGFDYIKRWRSGRRFHFSLNTKIVWYSILGLMIGSFLLYWMFERHNTLAPLSSIGSLINALFNSSSARGVGFSTVDVGALQLATLLLLMILAFIGASPGSTGSGVKTTSIVLLLATIKAAITGRSATLIRGRTISHDQIYQALAIVGLSILWLIIALFLLLITEQATFLELLFEVVSAFGNCGLSMGITSLLSPCGKFFIALTMIIGRVGCVAVVSALIRHPHRVGYSYPEERVMLG